MAKQVRVNNLDNVMKRIDQALKGFNSPTLLKDIGLFSRKRIFDFTKTGKSLADPSGAAKPIPKLKDLTVKLRKWYERAGHATGSFFYFSRSNLTLTGQMLDALVFKIYPSRKRLSVYVEATQRRKEIPMLKSKDPVQLTNAQVAREVSKDRPFMGMDDLGKRRIIQMVRKEIRNEIRKNRLRK